MASAQLDIRLHSVTQPTAPALGNVPADRGDGIFRGMSVQLNGMATTRVRNIKAAQLQYLIEKYDIQFVGLGEVGINWKQFKFGKRLLALLPKIGTAARCSVSYNTHENIGVHQQGGVGMIILNQLIPYYKKGCKDFRRLGRWDSSIIQGSQHHRTRLVQVYGVRPERSEKIGSVCQQHTRYIQTNLLHPVSPRELFESDFLWQLRVWRDSGDRLIVMMDANCHVLTGRLCRALTCESIGLREITKDHLGELCPNTHASGSEPIDGVWATDDITVTAVKWLSFDESPGDHRACIFDFTTQSAIGSNERRIILPQCRRLISTNPAAVDRYTAELLRQFDIHRIEQRLDTLANDATIQYPVSSAHQLSHNRLDNQTTEIQRYCERTCRKIYHPDLPFSPDISLWHRRGQIFSQMKKMVEGRIRNPGVLCRKARKLGILKPRQWTLAEILHGRDVCKAWKRELTLAAPSLRTEHLQNRLLCAEASKDSERAKAIRRMMQREENSAMWTELQFAFKDNGGRSNAVTRVERIEDGRTVEYTEQHDIERVVREETQSRFTLAESSPFCQGLLGEQLGYLSDTATAEQILNGTFDIPPSTSDATALLIAEIGRIGQIVKRGAVRLTISPDDFSTYWRAMKESTSSAASKVHFGHYKVAGTNERLSKFFAKKISFVTRTGCAPDRWGIGLTVLLEKVAGVALVHKLRAILLMEGDYNMHNRLIFGSRMMECAREAGLLPDEQFAAKESDGQDGAWLKRLFADISRQFRIAIGIVSADAEQCYDRIAHAFASLVFQAFGVWITAICALLATIQRMKFFLRTGFGESTIYMTALIGCIIHGLCQGNTAAPAGWSTISAILLRAYKRKGHGARFTSPITALEYETAGVLYVDDVDLFTMNSSLVTRALWQEVCDSSEDWTEILSGPGGAAKGEKCFGCLVDYGWLDNGAWYYAPVQDVEVKIVTPAGAREGIALIPAGEARVTLGIATAVNGDDSHHLRAPGSAKDKWKSIKTRADVWASRLRNSSIPPKYAWISYRLQLWASIRYGLGALSAPLADLGEISTNFAYRVMSRMGVNKNIKSGWRYLHSSFGGVGLLDLAMESVISRANLFVQHWGNNSSIGQVLQTSMECLQLEIGCAGCPFDEPFEPMGPITTHCWLRSFWEMIAKYRLTLQVDYPTLPLPRLNDQLIMQLAAQRGLLGTRLQSINRCRLWSNSLFLSDIASADGRRIDPTRGISSVDYSNSSLYTFQREQPSVDDWAVWTQFWLQFCMPDGSLPVALGKWLHTTHRVWEWYYHESTDTIYQVRGDIIWQYHPCVDALETRQTRGSYVYGRTNRAQSDVALGLPVSVEFGPTHGTVLRLGSGPPLCHTPEPTADEFWDFLRDWGGTWFWDHVHLPYGLDAVVDAIAAGSAIFVTDGSYNRKIRKDVDSAGWLVYCKHRQQIILEGSLHEQNNRAGSYRGELLGLLAIHVFILGIETFYVLEVASYGVVACDNLGALNKSQHRRKKISAGTKHADILRALSRVHSRLRGRLSYEHVYGHQDKHKTWEQMTLLERLNCRCDSLAKIACADGFKLPAVPPLSRQRLPLESAALFSNGSKISGECGSEIRFQVGHVEARHFYLSQLGWYASTFDNVDWHARDSALADTPDMFKLWLCKQGSSFCATGKNMGRWFGSEVTSCPNCGQADEDASHLLHCPDAGRYGLIRSEVADLFSWMQSTPTDPDLAICIREYILGRGKRSFSSLPRLPIAFRQLAFAQDLIGWDQFMEGKISSQFRVIQHSHLLSAPSVLTASDWLKTFITKLLHITHGQWIYRNISRHHKIYGQLRKTERRQLLQEIDRYMALTPDEVPEESRFLLEIDFHQLRYTDTDKQSYWVHAVKAAVTAGRRRTFLQRRRRSSIPQSHNHSTSQPPVPFGPTDDTVEAAPEAPPRKRVFAGAGSTQDRSNKRRKPD